MTLAAHGMRKVRLSARPGRFDWLTEYGALRTVFVVLFSAAFAGLVLYALLGDADPHERYRSGPAQTLEDSELWQWGVSSSANSAGGYLVYGPWSGAHPLGTDERGRDLLVRVAHAARTSLMAGLIALFSYLGLGIALGTAAGYLAGRWQRWVAHLASIANNSPILLLLLLAVIIIDSAVPSRFLFMRGYVLMFLLGIFSSPKLAELIRGRIGSLKQMAYIESALALGLSPWRIIVKHILWLECRPVIIVQGAYMLGQAMLVEATLTYLTFGLEYPMVSWGLMLRSMASGFFTGETAVFVVLGVMTFFIYYFHHLAGILNDLLRTERRERS